jgi:nitrite reductase/ring-hydroxylating ferredoxin subunit
MQPRQLFSTDKKQFICSTHYARFNFHDGFCTEGPCEGSSLEVIPIETRNAAIYVAATAGSGH